MCNEVEVQADSPVQQTCFLVLQLIELKTDCGGLDKPGKFYVRIFYVAYTSSFDSTGGNLCKARVIIRASGENLDFLRRERGGGGIDSNVC